MKTKMLSLACALGLAVLCTATFEYRVGFGIPDASEQN